MIVEFACLSYQKFPLSLAIEPRNKIGCLGIFRGGGPVGELRHGSGWNLLGLVIAQAARRLAGTDLLAARNP
jgi:hypothetical protein